MAVIISIAYMALISHSLLHGGAAAEVDLTRTPGAKGLDVVNAVNHLIEDTLIFPRDYRFFVRIAWVESGFGQNNDTFNPSNQGGIWKVAPDVFRITQLPDQYAELVPLHSKIQQLFSINWMTVVRADLDKPLYSGLAARLFFETVGTEPVIPATLNSQAQYWKSNYNKNDSVGIGNFINAVTELESKYTCHGKMDLVIVIDGSGSANPFFDTTLDVIANFLSTFSLDYVNIGFLRYSPTLVAFDLTNTLSPGEMDAAVRAMKTENGTDAPHEGIDAATNMLVRTTGRQGAPRVIAIFSDGGGNTSLITTSIDKAKSQHIISYAIDIGNCTVDICKTNFLIEAGGNPGQWLSVSNFEGDKLHELAYHLNEQMCRVSQHREVNIGDELLRDETRYYNFQVDENGLSLISYVKQGKFIGYWSEVVANPSSALHSGTFNSSSQVLLNIPRASRVQTKTIYVSVKGIDSLNRYTLIGVTDT